MRGDDPRHESMFSYVTPEQRVRADHPLRPIRRMTDAALRGSRPGSTACIRRPGDRRSRPRSSSARCCCRCCTAFAASGSWWSSWITTCCFGGSSA